MGYREYRNRGGWRFVLALTFFLAVDAFFGYAVYCGIVELLESVARGGSIGDLELPIICLLPLLYTLAETFALLRHRFKFNSVILRVKKEGLEYYDNSLLYYNFRSIAWEDVESIEIGIKIYTGRHRVEATALVIELKNKEKASFVITQFDKTTQEEMLATTRAYHTAWQKEQALLIAREAYGIKRQKAKNKRLVLRKLRAPTFLVSAR